MLLALAVLGALFCIPILIAIYVTLDFAAEKIARALRDSIRP